MKEYMRLIGRARLVDHVFDQSRLVAVRCCRHHSLYLYVSRFSTCVQRLEQPTISL